MEGYSQKGRRLSVRTPLGEDVFLLTRFAGREEMSRLFNYRLEMLSKESSVPAKEIVGKNITVCVLHTDGTPLYFNGFVSRFSSCGAGDRFHIFNAEMVPWLWFLTLKADCRIFQGKTVLQITEQVFQDLGFTDYSISEVKGNHPARDFCVQYRETDFDFISRLLEEEGIFHYFLHENGKHTLVLADQKAAYKTCVENEVEYGRESGQIVRWEHGYAFRTGSWSQTDFNFEKPSLNLTAKTSTIIQLDTIDKYEIYDYPGKYAKKDDGERLVKIRMEEEEAVHDTVMASSTCRTFHPGGKFTVKKHRAREEEGKSYVITSIDHSFGLAGSYQTGGGEPSLDYGNNFTCIPESVTFRPARITPRPVVRGAQTAVVVGPDGEEIYTDKYGRMKVKFHWDRVGKKDGTSSCWVRVSQSWAGKGWGVLFLPRIGQEVVITFLEGDPDRPLITGSVYNDDEMPPNELPANKTISTVKSNSSPGSGGFNEIRLEDKKGEEKIFIHGEKDLDLRVKNDSVGWIGRDQHRIVKGNQVDHVEKDRHEKIDGGHVESIGKDRNLKVTGMEAKEVGQGLSLTVKGDVVEVFQGSHSEEAKQSYYVKAMGVVIEASQGITLKAGGNSVVIDASGVTLKGAMVTIDGGMTKVNSGPGSSPASGTAGSATAPAAPQDALEADKADPGDMAEVKAEAAQTGKGRYAPVKAKISSSGEAAGEAAGEAVPEKTWYEFQVLDAAGQPMKDEPLKVTLQSGQVIQKKTDADGVVRIEDIDASDVASAELVDRQEGEWADLGAGERRTGAAGSGEAEEGSPPEETEEESSGIESGPAA